MGADPFTAALIGSAVVGLFGAKKQADATKKAAREQARAIEEANQKAAARDVIGKAQQSDVADEADVSIGDPTTRKRKSRIDLQNSGGTNQTGIGGL